MRLMNGTHYESQTASTTARVFNDLARDLVSQSEDHLLGPEIKMIKESLSKLADTVNSSSSQTDLAGDCAALEALIASFKMPQEAAQTVAKITALVRK